jgi:superfamily II DNA helicase RecQ
MVLVVPLVALKQDTVRRCELMGIQCSVWGDESRYGIGNGLVIVSLDQAVQVPFQTYLHQLEAAGQLGSIVIDECHLILTASQYREKMGQVKQFQGLSCQLIFLTATLPGCMLDAFAERLLLSRPVVIRGLSVRRDIQYELKQCIGPDMVAEAVEAIKATLQVDWFAEEREARAIVYSRTRGQADKIGAALGCPVYYSDSGTEEEKGKVLEAWVQGDTQVIAATSAFGAGIDYPTVRVVFHVGEPDQAINFAQEVGRGGRDGQGSVSCVILPRGWKAKSRDMSGELLCHDAMMMQWYLDSP